MAKAQTGNGVPITQLPLQQLEYLKGQLEEVQFYRFSLKIFKFQPSYVLLTFSFMQERGGSAWPTDPTPRNRQHNQTFNY